MTNQIKCELHIGDAVYHLEQFRMTREHFEYADCNSPEVPAKRIYTGVTNISAVIGDRVDR